MGFMLIQMIALMIVRPYIWREWPGWGKLYQSFVGDYRSNRRWEGYARRWMRGKGHGYEMLLDLSSWSNRATYFSGRYPDTLNPILIRAILKRGDTFLDVGANEGMISLFAACQVGPTGKVIAFEPNPGPAHIFAKAIRRNHLSQVDLRHCGLSDTPETLPLTVPAVNSGEGTFAFGHTKTDVSVIPCPVHVGDKELEGQTPSLIKIDVEGFEARVIAGLTNLLKRCAPPISLEVSDDGEALRLLRGLGYVAYLPSEVGRGRNLRILLAQTEAENFPTTTDVLMIHRDDTLGDAIRNKLAVTGPY